MLAALFFAHASGLERLRNPDSRFAIYRAAGNWLAANTPVDATVGALEVGIMGYYARRPMVDFAGLIQPRVAAQLTSGSNYEHAALWAVENYQPDYLALFQGDFMQLEQGYAVQHCRLDQVFNGGSFGYSKSLLIYHCQ
jgi:hypothetical protein